MLDLRRRAPPVLFPIDPDVDRQPQLMEAQVCRPEPPPPYFCLESFARGIFAAPGVKSPRQMSTITEREKMLAGKLYDPMDPDLVAARVRARDLCQALNATGEADADQRRRILRALFGGGGDSVWMQPPFFCDYGANIELGERVFFNFNCVVLDVCPVRIGSFTLFGPAVQILTPMHPFDAELRRRQEFGKPITIGSDVWVGGGALILPGVTIGARAVIGAGSVVTRDVPEDVFAAGNPCRVVREI
jgi:maltose O-acetyltransferase